MEKKLKKGDLRRMIVEELLTETPSSFVTIHPETGPMEVDFEVDPSTGAPIVRFGNRFTLSGMTFGDFMKLSQMFRQAAELSESAGTSGNLLTEEEYDCMRDYRAGTMSRQEYEDCLRQFRTTAGNYGSGDGRGNYGGYGRRSKYKKKRHNPYRGPRTTYTTHDPEALVIIDELIAQRPNSGFFQSIRKRIAAGQALSPRQKSAMQKVLIDFGMDDKLSLFECGEPNDPLLSDVYGDENVTNLSLDPEHVEELPPEEPGRSVTPW